MAGTAHSAYYTDLAYYVKNADVAGNATFMADNILKTIRDFCKETWIWRETLTEIDVVESQAAYTLTPGTDNSDSPEVFMVDWVKFKEDGNDDDQYSFLYPINLETEEVATLTGMPASYVNTEATPQYFYINPDDSLNLLPIPDANSAGTANLQVKCILNPALDATTTPTHIYNDWLETIAKGCAGRIMKMSGKKWYNPQLGAAYWAEYENARDEEARAQRWGGKNRTQQHVRIHPGFSGGSRRAGYSF